MGTELEMIKGLAGGGVAGLALLVAYGLYKGGMVVFDKLQANSDRKDQLHAATIKDMQTEFRAALKELATEVKAGFTEVKVGMEVLGRSLVDLDKGHTQQARETFTQVMQLQKETAGISLSTVTEVQGLKSEVGQIKNVLDDHGEKLDLLIRSAPGSFPPSVATETPPRRGKLEPPRNP